jgi:hypothetical protein
MLHNLRFPIEYPEPYMHRRAEQANADPKNEEMVFGPTVSLPALLDKGRQPDGTFRQLLYDISVVATLLESAGNIWPSVWE